MIRIRLPKKVKKRRPGQRANLSHDQILAAALELLEREGADGFTARGLAERLGVHPQAILGRFEGFADLRMAAAGMLLANIAPPFAPDDKPADYIRGIFRRLLVRVHGRGAVADLAAIVLAKNRMVAPRLLERLLVALPAAGMGKAALGGALDLVYAHLSGMIIVEAGEKQIASEAVSALSPGEFPTVHGLAGELTSAPPAIDPVRIADRYSLALLRGLGITLTEGNFK